MTAKINLDETFSAQVETTHYGADRPVIVVFQDGRRTPGQWFASTLVERGPSARPLAIDAGAGWMIPAGPAAILYGFAVGVLAALAAPAPTAPVHTIRGEAIGPEGSAYGVTHDYDCPACQGTSFTASPRSETYWAS